MGKLYIDTWWGKSIGSSEDTLILLNYFRTAKTTHFELGSIIKDINLNALLGKDTFEETELYYCPANEPNLRINFDLATNVLVDLTAIVLESIISNPVNLGDLSTVANESKQVFIQSDKTNLNLLIKALDYFTAHPTNYQISNFMNHQELNNLVKHSKEILNALSKFIF